uniref:uncharacterized protein LOC124069558 isoform X1 n=1 Tax=Scatophagus argus TaxID=75038 RepID=UPI001ED7F260|nr:uncharacterized protein LOC124069558 isoform X1 [Scatophagus argus]
MPIFVLTFVAVPWAASKAGRLIRSGLELIGTNSPRANPAESVPHDLPVIVPLPAQTYFQDRSFSGLRMLHQNNVRSPNQLPDENKQEKQEQDSTSATSKTDISSQSLKLPPFQDRSFSGLRMLHQNNVRSRTLLLDENKQEKQEQDSSFATSKIDISSQSELKMLQQNDDRSQTLLLDENKQEKQEQDSTSATSKTDISSQSLKLPRLALYMSVHLYPFASCGVKRKSRKDLTPHDRWMKEEAQFAAAFYVTYDEILACMQKYKERQQMVPFPTKVAIFFRAARARIMDLWFRIVEKIISVFAKAQAALSAWIFDRYNFLFGTAVLSLIYFFIYRKRPTMTAVFSSTEEEFPAVFPQLKQQEMYFPGNKRELLISFPHPQQRLQLFYPESKEGWTIVLKRTEHQMRLLLPGHLQGLQMVFPLSKQELPVPFPRPVEELLLLFPQSGQGIRVFFPGLTGRIRAAFFGAQRRIIQVVSWTRSRIAAGLLSASEWTLTLTRSQTDSQSCLHTLSNNNNHNHNNNNNNNTNNN